MHGDEDPGVELVNVELWPEGILIKVKRGLEAADDGLFVVPHMLNGDHGDTIVFQRYEILGPIPLRDGSFVFALGVRFEGRARVGHLVEKRRAQRLEREGLAGGDGRH